MRSIKTLLNLALLIRSISSYAQTPADAIDWPSFMSRQNLKWDRISTDYYTGMILGNGLLGTNIYKLSDSSIRFDVGRSDVVDNRQQFYPKAGKLYVRSRLPIGYFSLSTAGKITGASMELDIYNAEGKGTILTTKGEINFRVYVPADQNVISVEINAKGNEESSLWKWNPGRSISPRYLQEHVKDKPAGFADNPPLKITENKGYVFCNQPLLNKGGYTTAYKLTTVKKISTLRVSVGYDPDGRLDETREAYTQIKTFEKQKKSIEAHRNWWHHFYQQSFISIPDKRMESFYWIQLYKLASATRPGKPMLDLMGPWTAPTPWPAIWWNLNTQLAYSPVFVANHPELGQSLFSALIINEHNLISNVPEKWRYNSAAIGRSSSYDLISPISENEIKKGTFEPANLTWTLYYYYQYYAYTRDEAALRSKIYPLLKRSANFIIHLLKQDSAGIYHLPLSFSPEYKSAEDANYTLATLNWALSTLLKTNRDLQLNDKDAGQWTEILNHLAPYPTGSSGFLIGKDVALTSSHRHYSHLLMIYPYHLVSWERQQDRDVIKRSLEHWISLKGALQGYTYTGAASMYASMGDGDKSYRLINDLFDNYIRPNTLYRESGPVIETPLSAVASIQEMLLQSWGNKIRIFPAIPSDWKDACFKQLGAEGAFLVSARMQQGSVRNVDLSSLKGGSCTLVLKMENFRIKSDKRDHVDYKTGDDDGRTRIDVSSTIPGETITITTGGTITQPEPVVGYTRYQDWSWGLNKEAHR